MSGIRQRPTRGSGAAAPGSGGAAGLPRTSSWSTIDSSSTSLSHAKAAQPTTVRLDESALRAMTSSSPPLPPMTSRATALRMVPDKHYKYYDAGRPFPSQRTTPTVVTGPCFRNVCTWISFVAVGFLFFVGILLESQPLYIKGVKPATWVAKTATKTQQRLIQSDQAAYPYDGSSYRQQQRKRQLSSFHDRPNSHDLAMTAYRAMWAYLFTAVCCMSYGWRCWSYIPFLSCNRRAGYRDIPDHDSTIPVFHQYGGGGGDAASSSTGRLANTPSPMWTRTMFIWRKTVAWLEQNYRQWTRRQQHQRTSGGILPTHHHSKRHHNRIPTNTTTQMMDSLPLSTTTAAPPVGRRPRRRIGQRQDFGELPLTAADVNDSSKDR